MSAMWSFWDWMSFLDLFNTPYPNQPYMATRNPEELFLKIDEAKTKDEVVHFLRHFVCYNVGVVDADCGRSIAKHVRFIIRERGWNNVPGKPDLDQTEKVFNRLRQRIYGSCHGAGEDFNNFQPCPPKTWAPYKTLPIFQVAYMQFSAKRSQKWAQRFQACRNILADDPHKDTDRWKYKVNLMAEQLNCPAALLAGGLKKEF